MFPLIQPADVAQPPFTGPWLLAIIVILVVGGTMAAIFFSLRKKSKAAQAEWERRMREERPDDSKNDI